ncbi:MAG: hypothetical protein ACFFD7_12240 [Candidatus Thorarchaeota archaeon]
MTTDLCGIYFDFFGTLIDSDFAVTSIWSRIAKRLGKEIEYNDPRIREGRQKAREEAEKLQLKGKKYMTFSQSDWDYLNSFVLDSIGVKVKERVKLLVKNSTIRIFSSFIVCILDAGKL